MEPTLPSSAPLPGKECEVTPDTAVARDETEPQTAIGQIRQEAVSQRRISYVQGPDRASMQHWAEEVARLIEDFDQDTWHGIAHEFYRRNAPQPQPRPLTMDESKRLLETMISLDKKYDTLRVEARDSRASVESMLNDPKFVGKQYFFKFHNHPHIELEDSSRLSLSLRPDKVREVIEVLVDMMSQTPWSDFIRKAKIQIPAKLDKLTDSLLIYCTFNPERSRDLAFAIDQKIPQDFRLEHTPLGMERLHTGIAYGERKAGDSGSHGLSRTPIICKTLERYCHNPSLDLTRVLDEQIFLAGYSTKNPARLAKPSDFLEQVISLARRRDLTVEPSDNEQDCQQLFGRNKTPPVITPESEKALLMMLDHLPDRTEHKVQKLGFDMMPLSACDSEASDEAGVKCLKVSRTDSVIADESKPWAVLALCLTAKNTVMPFEQLLAELGALKQEQKAAFILLNAPETIKQSGIAATLYLQSDSGGIQRCAERLADQLRDWVQKDANIPVMEKRSEGIFYFEALNHKDSLEASRGAAVAMAFRKTVQTGYFLENLSESLSSLGLNPENPARLL